METTQLEHLARLRAAVGYLGERDQYTWWQSAFFAPTSPAFLTPVFTRTLVLAQMNGVTRAASMVHDERIGVGNVYHLFRLPEDVEQGIHRVLHNPELCEQITALVVNRESSIAYLCRIAAIPEEEDVGPMHIGEIRELRDPDHWSVAAARYARAFENHFEIYPYFADVK